MATFNPHKMRSADWNFVNHPSLGLIVTLVTLVGIYLLVQVLEFRDWVDAANLGGPLVLGLAATYTGYGILRNHPERVWTPYIWFLGAIVLFYSIGPLIYPLASSSVISYVHSFLPVTPHELLRTNLLNAVGILAILVGYHLAADWPRSGAKNTKARKIPSVNPITVALIFLIVGGTLQYLVILPSQFGMYQFLLPGIVKNLGSLYLLGLMVLAYVAAWGGRRAQFVLYILWPLQASVSLLVFSKQELVLTIFLPALGAYLAHHKKRRLFLWGLIAAMTYISVGNLVLYGRNEIIMNSGDIYQATLSRRLQITRDWFQENMPSSADYDLASQEKGWARLNYAGVQAFAMANYDRGLPGDTLHVASLALVPRLFWPEKPIISDMAIDFYRMVRGTGRTHLGLGLFGEGYWNFGWPGVVAVGLITGAIFAALGTMALQWIHRRAFEYLPSIFLGINMGIVGTTEFFAKSVVGAAGYFLVYALLVSLLIRLFAERQRIGIRTRHSSSVAAAARKGPRRRR